MDFHIKSAVIILVAIVLSLIMIRKTENKKNTFLKILVFIYFPLTLWSLFFYFGYLALSGLPMVWIWGMLGLFGFIRLIMIYRELKGKPIVKIPRIVRVIYRIGFASGLIIFTIVEGFIIKGMNTTPPNGLDAVIVLGAGISEVTPSLTLAYRIDKAAGYMSENPDTILIASGGQGPDEWISEGECIKKYLVEEYGIPEERIFVEDQSTSTEENLRFSRQFIEDENASVGIITSSFHEYRAGLIADREGYRNIYSVPARSVFPMGIHYTVREFFGVIYLMVKR